MPETPPTSILRIEVAWAERERQVVLALEVPAGTTAARAVELAELPRRLGTAPRADALGVHGRVVAPERVLVDGDRVELYRRLPADPKETRRRLAREGRTMGRAVAPDGGPDAGRD